MKTIDINVKIGGRAGEGVKITGQILAKAFTRLGWSTFSYQEYPSLIRGGHNTFQIHASTTKVYSQIFKVNLLLAFDQNTLDFHQRELDKNSLIVYDPEICRIKEKMIGNYLAIPLIKIAAENNNPLMANSVALGAAFSLLDLDLKQLNIIFDEIYGGKGTEIAASNKKCCQQGYKYCRKIYAKKQIKLEKPKKIIKRMLITGNEAAALGAVSAGLKFFSSYPMTPATSILHYLAEKEKICRIIVKQPEDEITAVNQAIGASFMGARAMTATSGGGFCLMIEGLGLSGMSETPLVIINSMRPGPATGMPTWSGQGDLRFSIHASQDSFPRLVLGPGDAEEAFELTGKALDWAEKYQLPVIILLDKNLSESYYSNLPFKAIGINKRWINNQAPKNYLRYKITENGISPRCFVGVKNGVHLANSYEHDESGLAAEEGKIRIKMMNKRWRKFEELKKEIPEPKLFGPNKSDHSIISWGSNKGPILEALKQRNNVNFLHLTYLWPFPRKKVTEFIKNNKNVYCFEQNRAADLASLIKEQTGLEVIPVLKYDGRPFYPKEIQKKLLKKRQ